MLRLAKTSFLLLVFSLAFMKGGIRVGGLLANWTDLLFLITVIFLGLAVMRGQVRLQWNSFYIALIVYLAAMTASAFASMQPDRSWLKLASQLYLLALPVLACTLIDSAADLRRVFQTWLAGSAVPALMGVLTVLLFALGVDRSLLAYPLHEFGTLPPGNYPRIETTFLHPAMLCNYLTVSLMILLASRHAGWIGPFLFYGLFGAILLAAAFTLTPGLGGIFLALSVWNYLRRRRRARVQAFAGLALGGIAAVLFVLAATVTPIIHPMAPFLIQLPGMEVAPAVRMMTWIDATQNFLRQPLIGSGIGTNAAAVHFIDPSGYAHFLTDAHNVFLNVAAQCGLVGLAALIFLIVKVVTTTGRLQLEGAGVVRVALGLAWLDAFVYQGLTGSYEDARHLWVLLGLLLASVKLEMQSAAPLACPFQST